MGEDEENMSNQSVTQTTAIINAQQWVKAVERKGRELIELNKESFRMREIPPMKTKEFYEFLRVEEHFFVVAFNKATRWLWIAGRFDKELQKEKNKIRSEFPHAVNVRNMREHDDEYLNGRGKKQDQFIVADTISVNEEEISFELDATSTISTNDAYLLGGRLDVYKAIEVFAPLYELLQDKLEEHWSNQRENI